MVTNPKNAFHSRQFTLQGWNAFPDRHGPLAGKLTQRNFQQEDRDSCNAQHRQVGDEKRSWRGVIQNQTAFNCAPRLRTQHNS